MRHLPLSVVLIAGLLLSIGVAQAQSTATVTATCKDGTAFTGAKRSGACRGHGGVQSWGAAPESSGLVNPAIGPASTPAATKSTAQAQSPGTITATCKDGTAFTGAKRSGACRGHGGVQSWGAAPESSGLVTPAIEPASTPAATKSAAQAQGTVTATCKDGTAFTGEKRSGACRGHGGVQSWGAAEATTIPVNAPAQLATPAPATSPRAAPTPANNGQVWVNTDSHVYHCPGTRWYGKTKEGTYMSEMQAQAQGAKPDHGKACAS